MLASGDLRQPVILDEKGKNQELVVEQLASRIAKDDVPNSLRDVQDSETRNRFAFLQCKNERGNIKHRAEHF